MAVPSQYLAILNQMQTDIVALGLTFSATLVPVRIVKIAQWLKGVSQPVLPIILICREDKPYAVTPWTTENEVLAKYNAAVIAIAAGNRDNTANMDVWFQWDEQIRRLFQWGLQPAIQSCFFGEVIVDPPVLRDAALKNYDVAGMGLKLWNVEQRTN